MFRLLSLLLLSLLLLLLLSLLLLLALTMLITVWTAIITKETNPKVENWDPGGQKLIFDDLPTTSTSFSATQKNYNIFLNGHLHNCIHGRMISGSKTKSCQNVDFHGLLCLCSNSSGKCSVMLLCSSLLTSHPWLLNWLSHSMTNHIPPLLLGAPKTRPDVYRCNRVRI